MSISPRSYFNAVPLRDARGFTLIEVLVAVSLLAIVLTSVYGVFGSVNAAKLRLDTDSADYHLARVVFDRLSRDIHGAYFRSKDKTTLFRGGINEHGESFLELTTTAVTVSRAVGAGIAVVHYRLALDQEFGNGRRVLLRSEQPRQSATVLLASAADERMTRLAPDVAGLTLRFFTDGTWKDQWEPQQNELPQLVEISLVIGQDTHNQLHFTTTFEIPDVKVK